MRSRIRKAAAMHRRAAALVAAVDTVLAARATGAAPATRRDRPDDLADRLRAVAGELAPGWLSAPLAQAPLLPLGAAAPPAFVRIGQARPPGSPGFPVVVPLGHLAFDTGAADPRVAGCLRATLLRMLASAAAGTLLVRMVDASGHVAAGFADLQPAGIMTPPVADRDGLDRILAEAEQWVAAPPDSRHLVVVLADWSGPAAPATGSDLARLASLAAAARQLHLLVAGWPPAGSAADLPGATAVRSGSGGVATVGHPSGGAAVGRDGGSPPTTGLQAPVILDRVPVTVVRQVCARVARQRREQPRVRLAELLRPEPDGGGGHPGTTAARGPVGDTGDGPVVTIGRAGRTPVTLRLGTGTWHWLAGGHRGAGKTALLHVILFGLVNRYRADQLAVHLVDPVGDGFAAELAELAPVRAVGRGTAAAGAVLRDLGERTGAGGPPAVCLVDGLSALDGDALAAVRALARDGPDRGVHLVLAGDGVPPPDVAAHCTVRIALPGGRVLDRANDAATGLAVGTAVVNTASGLGGPRGATRAHERLVRFPDPRAEPATVAGLQRRLARVDGAV